MAAKLMIIFLLITIVSFGVIGYLALVNMDEIGTITKEQSTELGATASADSIAALENLGEIAIQQKAEDVAGQVEIYLAAHPSLTTGEFRSDPELTAIAIQDVGDTGYTCLYEQNTGIMRLHPNPAMTDYNMCQLQEKLPSWWKIFSPSLDGSIVGGYYDWEDEDGNIRPKFMYMVPVEGTGYMLAATTYIDEFSRPATLMSARIDAATNETVDTINGLIGKTQLIFLGFFVFILILVGGAVLIVSRAIVSPIKELTRGAGQIGKGDLKARVEVHSGDELETLAGAFNTMASDLSLYMNQLKKTTAEKERMAKELEIAEGIQKSFLPDYVPEINGIEIAACSIPALEVGGDFYDFIPIDSTHWGLVIADVSGKGIPAALFMALSRTLIRASTKRIHAPAEAIREANSFIVDDSKSSMFVTLFYAILDTEQKSIIYVNAGHNPPLLLNAGADGDIALLKAEGIALGVVDDIDLQSVDIPLKPGDIMVLFTDGVTEAINERNEEFGQERLVKLIRETRMLPAREIRKRIFDEINRFAGDQPQADDITLIIIKAL
jgi:serine phosphatase RsbU (regulator of sigma subunit)